MPLVVENISELINTTVPYEVTGNHRTTALQLTGSRNKQFFRTNNCTDFKSHINHLVHESKVKLRDEKCYLHFLFFKKTNNDKHTKKEEMSRSNKVAYPVFIVSHFSTLSLCPEHDLIQYFPLQLKWLKHSQAQSTMQSNNQFNK